MRPECAWRALLGRRAGDEERTSRRRHRRRRRWRHRRSRGERCARRRHDLSQRVGDGRLYTLLVVCQRCDLRGESWRKTSLGEEDMRTRGLKASKSALARPKGSAGVRVRPSERACASRAPQGQATGGGKGELRGPQGKLTPYGLGTN